MFRSGFRYWFWPRVFILSMESGSSRFREQHLRSLSRRAQSQEQLRYCTEPLRSQASGRGPDLEGDRILSTEGEWGIFMSPAFNLTHQYLKIFIAENYSCTMMAQRADLLDVKWTHQLKILQVQKMKMECVISYLTRSLQPNFGRTWLSHSSTFFE